MSEETKAVVSVAEMARMVGLSRARFYQLQKAGVFPAPQRDTDTGRPFYTEGLQKVCLEVRRRNCGVNGKPILFYTRRQPRSKHRKTDQYAEMIEALEALGLAGVTAAQVGAAMRKVYPQGRTGVGKGEVIRAVFLHLKKLND